jgi:hypothetical protein
MFLSIAVVGFVVEQDDILQAHQIGRDALNHLAFGFECIERLADAALGQLPAPIGEFEFLVAFKGVEVGDDDYCASDTIEHIVGIDLAGFVVAVWIVGLEDSESISDREAWGDDEKTA